MAHCVFIAPPFAGHLNPLGALASALRRRGHRTTLLHLPQEAARIPPGMHALPVPCADATLLPRLEHAIAAARPGRWADLQTVLHLLAHITNRLCEAAPARLRAAGADLIVADQTEAAGGLIARHLGLPFASAACALPLNEAPELPPPFTAWRFNPSWAGRFRNRAGYAVSHLAATPLRRAIAQWSRQWGLGRCATLAACLSPSLQLSQLVPALDLPRPVPPGFHYTGPWRTPVPAPGPLTLPKPPFAFVSLGTLQGNRPAVLRAAAAACAAAGLGCLIAHGGNLPLADRHGFPPNTVLQDFVPQTQVLRHAALAVLHGGLNTVLDALAASVPMVLMPLAFEQPAIAMRVVRAGAGLAVNARAAPPRLQSDLLAALRTLQTAPRFQHQAATLAAALAASGGAALAAHLIEARLIEARLVEHSLAHPTCSRIQTGGR